MRTRVTWIVFVALSLVGSRPARADAGADSGADSGSSEAAEDGGAEAEEIACGGALCDTTNGAECAVNGRAVGGRGVDAEALAVLSSALVIGAASRVRRGARRPGSRGSAC